MLFAWEKSLGEGVMSRLHRLHSLDWEDIVSPGKASKHMLHVGTSKVVSAVWNFWIFA